MTDRIDAVLVRHSGDAVSAEDLEATESGLAVESVPETAVLDRLREGGVDCVVVAGDGEDPLGLLERIDAEPGANPPVVLYANGASADVLGRALNLGVDRYVDLSGPDAGVEDVAVAAVAVANAGSGGEDRFRTFFDNMPTAGFVVDDRGVTTEVNETFCERTGYDREEVVGKPLDELPGILPDADRELTIERFRQLSEGETLPPAEIEYRTKGGERRYAYVESVPVFEDGEFDRLIGISRDVTELKRREQELERQNERLERFAGILSHDLRNHIEVVGAEIELSRLYDRPPDVDRIEAASERMHQIVEDVLTMAREGGAVEGTETVSLASIAASTWDQMETGDADLAVGADLEFAADPSRLRELLENLYRNALDHAGEDASVGVGSLDGERGFYVEDDGPGIPEDERDAVFEAGYTTAEDGTGFGLNVVREMARAHGWSVTATESEDGGARFEVTGVETR